MDIKSERIIEMINTLVDELPEDSAINFYTVHAHNTIDPSKPSLTVDFYSREDEDIEEAIRKLENVWDKYTVCNVVLSANFLTKTEEPASLSLSLSREFIPHKEIEPFTQDIYTLGRPVDSFNKKVPIHICIREEDGSYTDIDVSSWRDSLQAFVEYLHKQRIETYDSLLNNTASWLREYSSRHVPYRNLDQYFRIGKLYFFRNFNSTRKIIFALKRLAKESGVGEENVGIRWDYNKKWVK